MVAPKRPSAFICSTISFGHTSSCSSFMTLGATSRTSHRSMASMICRASSVSFISIPSVTGAGFEVVAAPHDEHRAVELADDFLALIAAEGADADDALVGARLGFTLVEH